MTGSSSQLEAVIVGNGEGERGARGESSRLRRLKMWKRVKNDAGRSVKPLSLSLSMEDSIRDRVERRRRLLSLVLVRINSSLRTPNAPSNGASRGARKCMEEGRSLFLQASGTLPPPSFCHAPSGPHSSPSPAGGWRRSTRGVSPASPSPLGPTNRE